MITFKPLEKVDFARYEIETRTQFAPDDRCDAAGVAGATSAAGTATIRTGITGKTTV